MFILPKVNFDEDENAKTDETNWNTIPLRKNEKNPKAYISFFRDCERKQATINEDGTVNNRGVLTGRKGKNNITVVDLDLYTKKNKVYNKDKCLFINEYGHEFIKYFDTYTVKTPNGGYHLYFKYDKDIKQTQNGILNIDIRNDGGYIVSAGSVVNDKVYEVINNTSIKPFPQKLKEFLNKHLNPKIKHDKILSDVKNTKPQTNGIYNFTMTKEEFKTIVHNLPHKYWTDRTAWFVFTTASKILGYYDIWDEVNKTKPNYDFDNNMKAWNSADTNYIYTIDVLCTDSSNEKLIDWCKYKPTLKNIIEPDKIISKQKLGYDFFKNDNKNYIIKSDTGTGKTTSFKHYIEKCDAPFMVVTSRVSLCETLYDTLAGTRDIVKYYKIQNEFEQDDNICVQLDSIVLISDINFSKYIVFLDEFNSLIEYLITSETLTCKRVFIMAVLIKLLRECKKFICVDADISDTCIKFIKNNVPYKKYEFIQNTFKHNEGVQAEEIFNYNVMIDAISKQDSYLIVSDSKSACKQIKKDLLLKDDKSEIMVITSDENKNVKLRDENDNEITTNEIKLLDRWAKLIISPAILYGLDSVLKRPVYCLYKEHTITPYAMIQQMCRNRNITKLYFMFTKKKFVSDIRTIDDVKNNIDEHDRLGQMYFNIYKDDVIKDNYLKLLTEYQYIHSCFQTNKYVHFKKLIHERGFIISTEKTEITKYKPQTKQDKKEELDEKLLSFDIESKRNYELNKIMKIPVDKIKENDEIKKLFLDEYKLKEHFKICNIFFKDEYDIIDELENMQEFKAKKISLDKTKVLFIKKIRSECGLKDETYEDRLVIMIHNALPQNKQEQFFKEFCSIFRQRDKKREFKTKNDVQIYLFRMYKQLLAGTGLKIISSQIMKKGERYYEYKINEENLEYHEQLFNYRHYHHKKKLPNLFKKKDTGEYIQIETKRIIDELEADEKELYEYYQKGFLDDITYNKILRTNGEILTQLKIN